MPRRPLLRVIDGHPPGLVVVRPHWPGRPDLFAALLVAIVFAVAGIGPARPSRPVVMLSQGMLAVTIGLSVQRETLTALGSHWPAVVTVAIATLVLSVLAGLMLSLHRHVDAVTGILGMIAGGATGLVAVAGGLGADERTVVVAQYLRVALGVLTHAPGRHLRLRHRRLKRRRSGR